MAAKTTTTTRKTAATKAAPAKKAPAKKAAAPKADKGLLRRTHNRTTDTTVSIWESGDVKLPFVVKCEDHGKAKKVLTRSEARELRLDPTGFCSTCNAAAKRANRKAA